MTREELIQSKEYILAGLQLNLLNLMEDYMKANKLNREKLANQIGVSKGYISQVLNAAYDHKLSKIVDLSLSCNAVPLIFFVNKDEYLSNDTADKVYELIPVTRPRNVIFEAMTATNNAGYSKTQVEKIANTNFKYHFFDFDKLADVSGSNKWTNYSPIQNAMS